MAASESKKRSKTSADGNIARLDFFDSLRYGLAIWNADGRLDRCNRAFRDVYFSARTMLRRGATYEQFLRTIAGTGEVVASPSEDAWVASNLSTFGQPEQSEHRFGDGRAFEVVQDIDNDGHVLMTVIDVTTARRGAEALKQAKELAEQADRSKSRFLRAANHDLRQPLSTLKILVYNCMHEEDPEHRGDLLHAMDISVSIMEDLLGALLQIGQLDAGRIVPKITAFQISQLLDRLDVQFRHQAQEKGLNFSVVRSNITVQTDRSLLERILSNLVGNAIQYTSSGSILVGCRKSGGKLRIEVQDTGRGIEAPHLERIFDEFYQVAEPAAKRKRGLGLGLSIVKRLADLLGHPVSVQSQPGRGSAFRIEVPIGDVRRSEMGEPEISETVGGEFTGRVVLLIEDDDVLRHAATELLERWGIKVHSATRIEEVHSIVSQLDVAPHLIISDYSLRGANGAEVVDLICKQLGTRIPSIIITADTDPALIEALKAQGFPVLLKPVSPPRLRVLMHNLLYEPVSEG